MPVLRQVCMLIVLVSLLVTGRAASEPTAPSVPATATRIATETAAAPPPPTATLAPPTATQTLVLPPPTRTPTAEATKPKATPPAYWPTQGWRTSTPEEQGMDSAQLLAMFEFLQAYDPGMGSILIVRHGYLVLEAHYPAFAADVTQNIQSCSKSIMSTLIGIAIDQGAIEGVEQPVLDFYPDRTFANMDEGRTAITIEDLLTMRPGLRCFVTDRELTLEQMMSSSDWVQFFLDQRMWAPPGTLWTYCSPASYLLSAILHEATGQTALEFAQENLFDPLGIDGVAWATGPQGDNTGWGNIHLRSRDMAKFGYLFLDRGQWDGQQIISSQWVSEATRAHVKKTNTEREYGDQWWVDGDGQYYLAIGHYGQFIIVVPGLDLVVVFTGYVPDRIAYYPLSLISDYILPAAISDTPLPANPDAVAALAEHVTGLAEPRPQPVPPLPEMAHQVSGQTYFCPEEGRTSTLLFSDGAAEAVQYVNLTADDPLTDLVEERIGLDGVYRHVADAAYTNGEYLFHLWLKGFWKGEDEFVIPTLYRLDHPYGGFPLESWCSYKFEGDLVIYTCGGDAYPRGASPAQTCMAESDE